jgi:Asp-tRNA(Asn)/Glu-tRNA(Gln) amidotransferase A subunit family amidase
MLDEDADVVRMLDDAGAVLVAKLTLGALAMGDVWFGGTTRNPWNPEQGSSGSSAGPGSAVAAGCVPFAIGSETLGSIVSPSNRNGVTGLRPTFGRVSRTGAMTLSWTMDKLGPMCRSAEDCALVFSAIHGASTTDPVSATMPFEWPPERRVQDLRVGFVDDPEYRNVDADRSIHDVLRNNGVALRSVNLPERATGPMLQMLRAEASAAFDDLVRSGRVDELVRQDDGAWPATFRAARFIPAVEYINASRVRTLLMQDMRTIFQDVDVVFVPTFGANQLAITNLTGHPSITFPNTVASSEGRLESITIIGDLYADEAVLALASFIQSRTSFHLQRPDLP